MRSRLYYTLLAVAVALLLVGSFVTLVVLYELPWGRVLWILEVSIILLAVILLVLFRKFVRPLEVISHGMGLLKEQDFSSRLLYVGQKDADGIVDMFNSMMSRLKEEKQHLAEQERFLSQIIDASPLGIMVLDMDGRISQLNPAMCRFLGLQSSEPVSGRTLSGTGIAMLAAAERLEPDSDMVYRTENRQDIYKITSASFMDRGMSHRFFLFERMTDEIFNAEKNAWRKVIRVISHEVNNTVAGVGSAVEILGNELENEQGNGLDGRHGLGKGNGQGGEVSELVSTILSRLHGMSRFISNYADMVRLPLPHPEPTDPVRFLRSVFPVLESLRCGSDIELSLETGQSLRSLSFDRILMEQVLVNIVKNAVESINSVHPSDGVRGNVRIVAEENRWMVIDNGAGIPDEVASSLFTPFFSTKTNGQGIGLMLVREILSGQGLSCRLYTEKKGRTVFEILFP